MEASIALRGRCLKEARGRSTSGRAAELGMEVAEATERIHDGFGVNLTTYLSRCRMMTPRRQRSGNPKCSIRWTGGLAARARANGWMRLLAEQLVFETSASDAMQVRKLAAGSGAGRLAYKPGTHRLGRRRAYWTASLPLPMSHVLATFCKSVRASLGVAMQ